MHPKKKFALLYLLVVIIILWAVIRPACLGVIDTVTDYGSFIYEHMTE